MPASSWPGSRPQRRDDRPLWRSSGRPRRGIAPPRDTSRQPARNCRSGRSGHAAAAGHPAAETSTASSLSLIPIRLVLAPGGVAHSESVGSVQLSPRSDESTPIPKREPATELALLTPTGFVSAADERFRDD